MRGFHGRELKRMPQPPQWIEERRQYGTSWLILFRPDYYGFVLSEFLCLNFEGISGGGLPRCANEANFDGRGKVEAFLVVGIPFMLWYGTITFLRVFLKINRTYYSVAFHASLVFVGHEAAHQRKIIHGSLFFCCKKVLTIRLPLYPCELESIRLRI